MKISDYDNLICKIFSSEVADYNHKQLKQLMVHLLDHFPYTDKGDGNKEPYDVDSQFAKKWFSAYNHIVVLTDFKNKI